MMKKIFTATLVLIVILLVQPVPVTGINGYSEPKEGIVYKVEKEYTISNEGANKARDVVAGIYLLDNHDDWASQKILSEQVKVGSEVITPLPSGNEDNRMKEIQLGDINSENSETINVTQILRVNTKQIHITSGQSVERIPESLEKYTKPVKHLWQSDDEKIKSKAEELTQGLDNYCAKARRLLEWVREHMTYEEQAPEYSAVWAYESGRGDCTEYSNLFIALARAADIPAKTVSGYLFSSNGLDFEGYDLMDVGHQWVVIYLPSTGWVSVDLTYGKGQFGKLSNDHVIELISGGSNWVDEDKNKPKTPTWYVSRRPPSVDIQLESSGSANRLVAVNPSISASNKISDDGTWKFTVNVRNVGSQPVSDVEVRLETDSDYFEAPPAKTLGKVSSKSQKSLSFDMNVEKSFENSKATAIVEYETDEYGSFKSTNSVSVSAEFSNSRYGFPISLPVSPQVLVGLITGVIVLITIVFAFRR